MKPQAHDNRIHEVLGIRHLTDSSFILSMERNNWSFAVGQHMALGLPDHPETREYSVYSGEGDRELELLIKEVEDGTMSVLFKRLVPGDVVLIHEPVGSFLLPPGDVEEPPYVFVASGTGIAPFHSFARTYPDAPYRLLHGVRAADEAYEREHYGSGQYVLCTSRDTAGDYQGRVTDYLRANVVDTTAIYCLCGNYQMITEVYSLLIDAGVPAENVRSEVYFHF